MRAVSIQTRGRAALRAACALVALAGALAAAPTAHAALFEDDEARKAILDLRKRVDQNNEQLRARQNEQADQMRGALLDLSNKIETQSAEIAKLRGSNEQLARDLANAQQQLKDLQQSTTERLAKFEPQMVTVDGKEFMADPAERRAYDDAMAMFRKSDFAGAANAFVNRRELEIEDFELPDTSRRVAEPGDLRSPRIGQDVERPVVTSLDSHRASERERILSALSASNWNRVKAAKLVGMPRRTFYRRLKEYGIQ